MSTATDFTMCIEPSAWRAMTRTCDAPGGRCNACTDMLRAHWRAMRRQQRRTKKEAAVTATLTRQPAHPVPGDWAKRAACIGHPRRDMWFTDEPGDRKIAIAICHSCPVRSECAEHGISHEAHGIWGGLSENERRRARRQRRHGQEAGTT